MKTEIYKHIEVLVNRYPVLNSVKDEIVEAYFLLVESYKNEGKYFSFKHKITPFTISIYQDIYFINSNFHIYRVSFLW